MQWLKNLFTRRRAFNGVFLDVEKWDPKPSILGVSGGSRSGAQEAMHLIKQMTPEQRLAHQSLYGDVSVPVPGLKYHGLRADGVYVPIVIVVDLHGEPGDVDMDLTACREEEARRLHAAGHSVAG